MPFDPIDVHVGARIRARRIVQRMSQTAFGEQLGVTFQQVQKYEIGSNRISASMLWRAARALDVAPGFFFEGLSPSGATVWRDSPMNEARPV